MWRGVEAGKAEMLVNEAGLESRIAGTTVPRQLDNRPADGTTGGFK